MINKKKKLMASGYGTIRERQLTSKTVTWSVQYPLVTV